jgi:hypothetical protein
MENWIGLPTYIGTFIHMVVRYLLNEYRKPRVRESEITGNNRAGLEWNCDSLLPGKAYLKRYGRFKMGLNRLHMYIQVFALRNKFYLAMFTVIPSEV